MEYFCPGCQPKKYIDGNNNSINIELQSIKETVIDIKKQLSEISNLTKKVEKKNNVSISNLERPKSSKLPFVNKNGISLRSNLNTEVTKTNENQVVVLHGANDSSSCKNFMSFHHKLNSYFPKIQLIYYRKKNNGLIFMTFNICKDADFIVYNWKDTYFGSKTRVNILNKNVNEKNIKLSHNKKHPR